ncbi:hypothetical protein TWF281_010425 [Arthrobotrys megalospora]
MPAIRFLLPISPFPYTFFPNIDEYLSPSPSTISTSTTTLTTSTTITLTTTLLTLPSNAIPLPAAEPTQEPTHKAFLNLHIPGLDPASPYFTSSATNETMLTNAIFSHPAIITWVSLFFAFLVFAGVVFGLQKVMRRVRARRWIRDQVQGNGPTATKKDGVGGKACCTDKDTIGNGDRERKVRFGSMNVYRGCEFINGSDISLRADEGVDERSGSWSKRRDKRFKQGPDGRKRRIGAF